MKRFKIPEGVEIQKADPGARSRSSLVVIAVLLAVIAFAYYASRHEEQVNGWIKDNALALAAQPTALFLVAFLIMLPMVGLSAYIFRQGSKVVSAERFPYPGQKVIKDTPIISGRKAVRQGRGVQILAVFMGVMSLLLPFLLAIVLMLIQQEQIQ